MSGRAPGAPEADGHPGKAPRIDPYFSPCRAEKAKTLLGEGR
ncbi:hypothetical protein [Kitasatospora sp. GP82]|nr:hypothetical protein [Kitasatospora sp. GP82]MDH6123796.1 hypothetical protein [Kitasatospora sp. GP82]